MLPLDQGPVKRSPMAFLSPGLKAGIIGAALIVLAAGTVASAGANRTFDMERVTPYEFNGDVRDLQRSPMKSAQTPSRPFVRPVLRPPYVEKTPVPPLAPELAPLKFTSNLPHAPMPAATHNFNGMSFNDTCTGGRCGSGWPPDPNGDVGPNHFIQAVNTAYAIYSKNGTTLAAFTEDNLWSSVSGTIPCNGNSEGDTIVLYDQLADRWILTHFAFPVDGLGNPLPPFYECIAVSKSNDPVSGGWWLYPLQMDPGGAGKPPAGTLNDYPKFGIWNDCLYMSANEFDSTSGVFVGTVYSSMSRSDLEGGGALTWSLGFINNSSTPFSMIPSNLLGPAGSLPPAGTPNYFVSESQSAFSFEVRKFTAGPNCGGGGSLSAPMDVGQTSYVTTGNTGVVPQPGTTNKLDMIDDRLMQKVQYRNMGGVESLWVVHNVLTSSTGPVALQWAQIDVSGGTIAATPVQQQIYSPDPSLYRWMGSLAVDKNGNMALGYSTSGRVAPDYPSIAYSGRLATDPTGTLPQTEVELVAGAGSQTVRDSTNTLVNRWGDYTAMSMDPADDCTFWYTNQYYSSVANGANGNWQTRIGSFKFPLSVVTASITGITLTSATGGGNVTNDGCATVTGRGVCWSIGANPTTADTCAVDGAPSVGTFASALTGLVPGILYHVRAYATNSGGTVYGNDVSFTSDIVRPNPPTGLTVN